MRVGIPKEIKTQEGRVALIPSAVRVLVARGVSLTIQQGAGEQSGYSDQEYLASGASLLPDAEALYQASDLILKVKEPVGPELDLLEARHLLFSFLHLAAEPELTERLCQIGLTAIGFETIAEGHRLPLLAPMSQIAGRIAAQTGTCLLHRAHGGKGVLLGGVDGTSPGKVLVLGAGQAGGQAVRVAAAMGAEVTVFDRSAAPLAEMATLGPNVSALEMDASLMHQHLTEADLVIGAVLVPGRRAPKLVSASQIAEMEPGSVIIDIAVDQGGCIETIHPTTHADPTYLVSGVLHYGVTNMPGVVPRTASEALSGVLLAYVERLTDPAWRQDAVLSGAINLEAGKVVHPALMGTSINYYVTSFHE